MPNLFCHFGLHIIEPGVQIFIEHWGEGGFAILPKFCPIFNIEGDEPRPRFFQVSKLSEDQKIKPGLHRKWKLFFPRIEVETCAQMHTRVKLLEGMQMKTILKLLGGIQSNYWEKYIPHPPRVSAPLNQTMQTKFNACIVL